MEKLQIYKASAGSGKTYLLTGMFLQLAFKDPNNFNKILAVTFTNKATEEMKVRILTAIDKIIVDGEKADHFNSVSEYIKEKSVGIIRKKARRIRDNILHNYTAFNVSTIDSFVQKIIRSFTYEMNLNSTYSIELDTDKVIEDLTDILYKKVSEDEYVKERLIQFVDFKINEGKSWDFRNELKDILKEIFKEKFQSLKKSNGDKSDEISEFMKSMYGIINSFESKINKLSDKYIEVIENKGINYNDLGSKFQIISNHFIKKIPKKDYRLTKALIESIEGEENWYKKKPEKEIVTVISSVYNDLFPLVIEFFKIIEDESLEYNTARVIVKNIHSLSLIKNTTELLPDYRNDNNILFISDTTVLLKEIIGNNDAPFIYEKIGNQFKHILIDEFQDTSDFQWFNFKPLIENSISQGFYNLIVGDIKQAIYRWRNGDWRHLLSGVKESIGSIFVEEQTLETNWRSKENIINFNNSIFEVLAETIQEIFNSSVKNLSNDVLKQELISEGYNHIITEAYKEHKQKIPKDKEKSGGTVEIKFYKNKYKIEDYLSALSEDLPYKIDELLKGGTFFPGDIALLVRSKKEAKQVSDLLLNFQKDNPRSKPYQVISPESLFIKNSRAVRIIIAVMKYCSDPDDQVNTAHLVYEYQLFKHKKKEINGYEIFSKIHKDDYTNLLPADFTELIESLLELSLYEFSDRIIDIFNLKANKSEYPYIRGLQDLISEQSRRRNPDLSEFLDWWEKPGKDKSIQISENNNAVSVMTVHKSKGLAFKVVILPFAKWSLGHSGNNKNLIWSGSDIKPFDSIGYIPLDYSKSLADTVFGKEYFNETLLAYIDNLNILYVALTRAKEGLYMYSSYSDNKKGEIKNIGKLLHHVIDKEANNENDSIFKKHYIATEDKFIYNINNKADKEILFKKADSKTLTVDEIAIKDYPTQKIGEKFKIKLSSKEFFIESIEQIKEKVNYGILMHKVFSEIKTYEDVESIIKSFISQGYITEEESVELEEKVKKIISKPEVAYWFSDKFDVKNEEALITEKGDIKIPDRVLIGDTNAIVIDFKFGKKQKEYVKQISEYKTLIEEVYKKKTEGYIFYVEENEIINV